jgi:hypothetical protein
MVVLSVADVMRVFTYDLGLGASVGCWLDNLRSCAAQVIRTRFSKMIYRFRVQLLR